MASTNRERCGISCTPNSSQSKAIIDKGADYLLALKRNQPSLHDEVAALFAVPAATGLASHESIDKDHGRIETRICTVATEVDWLDAGRRHPLVPRG